MQRRRQLGGVVWAPVILALLGASFLAPANAADTGWATHRDAGGFTARYPSGWVAESSAAGRVLISTDHHAVFVLIQPFLLRDTGQHAAAWLEREPARFTPPFTDAQVGSVQPVSGGSGDAAAAKMTFRTPDGRDAQANLLCAISGKSGVLYAIAAPQSEFESRKAALLEVLQSIHFVAPPKSDGGIAAGADRGIRYITWTDPHEGAFHLQVPQGWKVDGGLVRHGIFDIRPYAWVTSPDGQIEANIGSPDLTTYTDPSLLLARGGIVDGNTPMPGMPIVRHYVSGEEFAHNFTQSNYLPDAQDLQFLVQREIPVDPRIMEQLPPGIKVTAGAVAYSYQKDGRKRVGGCFAATEHMPGLPGMGGLWFVSTLGFSSAPPDRWQLAYAVDKHILLSFRFDQKWLSEETRAANQVAHHNFQATMKSTADSFRGMDNLLTNSVDLVDPGTGQSFQANAGASYYWRSGSTVVGTSTYHLPGVGFSALKQW